MSDRVRNDRIFVAVAVASGVLVLGLIGFVFVSAFFRPNPALEAVPIEVEARNLLVDHKQKPAMAMREYGGKVLLIRNALVREVSRKKDGRYLISCDMLMSQDEMGQYGRLSIWCSSKTAATLEIDRRYEFKAILMDDHGGLQFEAVE